MTDKPENPPAFPRPDSPKDTYCDGSPGMTLRDWFAGMYMQGWVASGKDFGAYDADGEVSFEACDVAGYAYDMADAMLETR